MNQQARREARSTWKYWVLSIAVIILIPMWVYQEVWGVTAQHRKSEASNLANQGAAASHQQAAQMQEAVEAKRILVGMSASQARAAWGTPDNVNRTETAHGSSEQWVYGNVKSKYVYLKNGVVTSFQVSEGTVN